MTALRLDGTPTSSTIVFLPWGVSFLTARIFGFTRMTYRAAYLTPLETVSDTPEPAVAAIDDVLQDSRAVLRGIAKPKIVGLSLGNCAATIVAAEFGADLISVTPADRADRMIWESPAAAQVKASAEKKGLSRVRYGRRLKGYHPEEHVTKLAAPPHFFIGARDKVVPSGRSGKMIELSEEAFGVAHVTTLPLGHLGTLVASCHLLAAYPGYCRRPSG